MDPKKEELVITKPNETSKHDIETSTKNGPDKIQGKPTANSEEKDEESSSTNDDESSYTTKDDKSRSTTTDESSFETAAETLSLSVDSESTMAIANPNAGAAPASVSSAPSKESFANKLEYILTLISYAIGFGTMWRFPYLMQENGGVVFLIPYFFMLLFLGIPIFLLELTIGQRLRKSSFKVWAQISPLLAGLGIACAISCLLIGFYENTLIAWCCAYFINVFKTDLPWSNCSIAEPECTGSNNNASTKCRACHTVGASSYFWYNNILGISSGITNSGDFNGLMCGCLIFSWILIWAILVRGMKVAGKIAYLTSILPYIVMAIFLIRGFFLEGMEYGFEVVFTPNWSKLLEIKVWFIAGTQILFTQGVAVGILVSYSALQSYNNNCIKDAVTVPMIDFCTSILASIVNCPILGSKGLALFRTCKRWAEEEVVNANGLWNLTINETTVMNNTFIFDNNGTLININSTIECDIYLSVQQSAGGTGLIFITFTQAVQEFPVPQLWAFLFFTMLLTVGVGSSFPQVEGFVLCVQDVTYHRFEKHISKGKITTFVCLILMIFSMVYAWGWGQYMLTFLDEFTANWSLLIIAEMECLGVAYIYGLKKFAYDLHLMTGVPPSNHFVKLMLICLKFISPIIMLLLFVFSLIKYGVDQDALSYFVFDRTTGKTDSVPWPTHVLIIGFLIATIVVGFILLFPILAICNVYPFKQEPPAHFPEKRLKHQRNISVCEYDEEHYKYLDSFLEKMLYWKLKCPKPDVDDEDTHHHHHRHDTNQGEDNLNELPVPEPIISVQPKEEDKDSKSTTHTIYQRKSLI